MSKRIICWISLVLMLGMAGNAAGALAAYWTLDEGSGDAIFDSSGNGNDGTIHGAQWTSGKYGNALEFNSVDNYVEVPTSESLEIETNVTVAAWINWTDAGDTWLCVLANGQQGGPWENYGLFVNRSSRFLYFTLSLDGGHVVQQTPNNAIQPGEWLHACATWDGSAARIYVNGQMALEQARTGILVPPKLPLRIGHRNGSVHFFSGLIDEVRIYDRALSGVEILAAMEGGVGYPYALAPNPKDGALIADTWVNLSWSPGDFAVSHDIYLDDNFDDVNNGIGPGAPGFRGNQTANFYVAGFPGFAYPEGLVPGTTYYWRIDEVNEAEPNSPWKGKIWSFSIPPRTAYNPNPADGTEFVAVDSELAWTPGFRAKLHTVYIGTDFDTVSSASGGAPQGVAKYKSAAPFEPEKVYYWRVDEFDALATYKGDVWGFTSPGAAGGPSPANRAAGVQMNAILSWMPAASALSHDVYLGTDKDVVRNATTASPEYIGNKATGAESYDPGKLAWNSNYYWRVDAVYSTGTVKGLVWSFTTADFITVDDFESYNDIDPPDPNSNRIFDKWIDGFGTTDNGALVGNDMPPYAEQTIVHGGAQSMPYRYDNANKTSEAALTLVYPSDWTEEGVTRLSLWFRGTGANAADKIYVALNGNGVVYHDNTAATQKGGWNQWIIDLKTFADQGVNLASVNTITIGIGTKGPGAPGAAGGTGTMYFDDICLIR